MKLIYGLGNCELEQIDEEIKSIVIKYDGRIVLSHNHFEIMDALSNTKARCRNINNSLSLLIHGNSQIHIGFTNQSGGDIQLFKYSGLFKIISVKVNDNNIHFEISSIDNCDLINSTFDTIDEPEKYRKGYVSGMIPKKKKMEAIKTNKLKNLKSTKLFKSIKTRITKKPARSDRTKTGTGGY